MYFSMDFAGQLPKSAKSTGCTISEGIRSDSALPEYDSKAATTKQGKRVRWVSVEPPNGVPADETVWVSVAKLDASWKKRRVEYIGPGGTGPAIGDRYSRFGIWLQRGEAVWIPWVGLARDRQISFTDGRHRFAWLRDHGVTAVPIDVDPDEAKKIEKRFGTTKRVSIYT
jgi:hypothetical protein